jgi:hypothetical protein
MDLMSRFEAGLKRKRGRRRRRIGGEGGRVQYISTG